jgi:hypothetical protein
MLSPVAEGLRDPRTRRHHVVWTNLALVLVFLAIALYALISTWHSARAIRGDLALAADHSHGIATDTSNVSLLDRTATLTGRIAGATAPLPGQAADLDRTVGDVRAEADAINRDAGAIDTGVRHISARVEAINATVAQILEQAERIRTGADAISSDAAGIQRSFAQLLPVIRLVDDGPNPYGVQNIDRNTDTVIELTRRIRADLGDIAALTPQIDRSAASICSAPLIAGPGCAPPH